MARTSGKGDDSIAAKATAAATIAQKDRQRSGVVRILTSLVIIGICLPTIYYGILWLQFLHFDSALAADMAANPAKPDRDQEIARLNEWTKVMGVRVRAHERLVAIRSDQFDLKGLEHELEGLLSVRPAAGDAWIRLAEVRFALDQPIQRVLAALNMSILTMPRESAVMFRRVDFSFRLWQQLPEDLQTRAVRDFIAIEPLLNDSERGRLRVVITEMPEDARDQLRAAARRWSRDEQPAWFSRVGL